MAETTEGQGLGEGIRTVAREMNPREIEPKLEKAMEKQPLLPHLLSFRVVGIAVAVAVVVALVLTLLIGPMMGALGLLVAFFATWILGARSSYEKRRPTEDAASGDDSEG